MRPRLLLMPSVAEVESDANQAHARAVGRGRGFDVPGVGVEVASGGCDIPRASIAPSQRLRGSAGRGSCSSGTKSAPRRRSASPQGSRGGGGACPGTPGALASQGRRSRSAHGDITKAVIRLAHTDPRSFVRALARSLRTPRRRTRQALHGAGRPQHRHGRDGRAARPRGTEGPEPVLRSLDVPMLLIEHKGCLLWTDEGFQDSVPAFPRRPPPRWTEAERRPRVRRGCATAARRCRSTPRRWRISPRRGGCRARQRVPSGTCPT